MLQKLTFDKGIDVDTSPEVMPQGVGRYRLNVRVMSSEQGNDQDAETTLGNTLISYNLPSGNNTVIGSKEYPLGKKIYYFIYNDTANHAILEYDEVTNAILPVLISPILNFQITNLITGINIIRLDINNHLLYWTDNFNEPRKINIEKGKYFMVGNFTLGYTTPFEERFICRIKQPPLFCPEYTWSTPTSVLQFSAYALNPQNINSGNTDVINFDATTYNPVAAFNTTTHIWTVPTTGVYNIHTILLLTGTNAGDPPNYTYTIYIKNGSTTIGSLNETEVLTGNFTFDLNNVPLNAGDLIHIEVLNSTVLFSVPIIAAVQGIIFEARTSGLADTPNINSAFKKLFQFKSQFVFDDFEVSSWSPISKYYFPDTLQDPLKPDDIIFQDSIISLQLATGSSIVKKIRVAVKGIDDTNFSLVAEIDKGLFQIADNSTYTFTFLNNGNYLPLEINESIKLFDSVPKKSKSQELIYGNRITDGLITEGYDGVIIDIRLPITYGLVDSSTTNDHYPKNSYLKSGGTYLYGIVYYDDAGNRSGTTQITEGSANDIQLHGNFGTKLPIPFLTDPIYAPGASTNLMSYVPIVTSEIYNEAPSWPSHYQILRSKNLTISNYIQFTAEYVSYSSSEISVIISNIYIDYKTKYPNSILVYDFVKGDRIRFIAPRASSTTIGTPYLFNDSEIISFDPATGILILKNNFSAPTGMTTGVLFEIYTPSATDITDNDLMYEVCEEGLVTYDSVRGHYIHSGNQSNALNAQIITNFTSATYTSPPTFNAVLPIGHGLLATNKVKIITSGYNVYGTITSVTATSAVIATTTTLVGTFNGSLSGTIAKCAIDIFSSGDCFRRKQDNYYTSDTLTIFVEAINVSNMFSSKAWDYGRPNRIDSNYREVIRPSTVYFSQAFIPETFINGLSTVYDESFETYEDKYGGIYKMYAENQSIIAFQELKVGKILVEQIILNEATGGSVVGTSTDVLSPQMEYYIGEFGIGQNPESFAVYGPAKYFIDVNRGVVLRLSDDGMTAISDLYKMHNYFINKCKAVTNYPSKVNIYGVFDVKFGEYIISFQNIPDGAGGSGFLGETLAFNEDYNSWSTFYSYLPDYMCQNDINIISFKNGRLYTHNTNSLYNNFYGVQYKSNLWFYCNSDPSNIKVFKAISLETTDSWNVTIETPITQQNPVGQTTSLISNNFQIKEGFLYSDILMDDNTPNIVPSPPFLPNARFEGNPMRAQYALIKLEYESPIYNRIFACNILFIPSQRSNQ